MGEGEATGRSIRETDMKSQMSSAASARDSPWKAADKAPSKPQPTTESRTNEIASLASVPWSCLLCCNS